MKTLVWLPLALLLLPSADAQPSRPPSLQSSATASVSVPPDEAQVRIGVVSQASTAAAAASQNAAQLQKTLDQLKAAAGPKAEVKTISYSVTPNYEARTRALKSFTATNIVQVVTSDLASVGKIIDAATQAGANEVQSLEFTLKDQSLERGEALRKAALEARANAQAMASALGLRLGKVIYLDTSGAVPIRMPFRAMAAAETVAVPTPIEQPQSIEVQATVTLTIALEQ